jgi:chromosomal replication initiation ATPase DnaA
MMNLKREINKILKNYGVSWVQVKSQRREWQLVECRKDIVRLLRQHDPKKWSYPAIGRLMDRDHTSIMHLASDDFRQRRNKQVLENHHRRRETRLNASTGKLTA